MRQLLEDYKRRLITINEELKIVIDEGSDLTTISRLTIKRGCYQTFISELERIVPSLKPIDSKVTEKEKQEREQEEREYQKKQDAFNQRLLNGEFEDKELEYPKGPE